MKTLDEVIDTFEKACDLERRCEGCPGCLSHDYGCPNDGAESVPDALHYLKEYREYIPALEKKYHDTVTELNSLKDEIWKDETFPLTWDELKSMVGKPVWVEGCGYSHGFWVIIDYFSDDNEYFVALGGKCDQFWKQDMTDENNGDSWQAYRKERTDVQS